MWRFSVRMLFAMMIIVSVPIHSQTTSLPRFSGRNLRTNTETIVAPLYPQDAITVRRTGVAVALVTVTEKGVVSKVEVLEAPSPSIGASLSDALSQWRFKTATIDGHTTGYTGKVTYYFIFQNGKPAVLDPSQVPYIGHWSAKTRS